MLRPVITAALAAAVIAAPALAQRVAAPEGASAYIVSPEDGATVTSPVTVLFGLRGMGVAPAGVEAENAGHHHLLVNIEPDAIAMDESLPADETIRHFGGGQTEASLELERGQYTLRLLLGDMNHVPHDPPVLSEPITITVE